LIVNANGIIRLILAAALLLSLYTAGWNIYRQLPSDGANARTIIAGPETEVTIIKYDAPEFNGKGNDVAIEAFPIDFATIRREFMNGPHAEISFEDFLAKRMKGKTPVRATLDSNGHAVIKLGSGNWWLHATMADGDNAVEWRLPITVAGNKQTVELTKENAYERSKKF